MKKTGAIIAVLVGVSALLFFIVAQDVEEDLPEVVFTEPKDDIELRIVSVDPSEFDFVVKENSESPDFVAEWASTTDGVVVNGAYFHEDYSASGYVVADGKELFNKKMPWVNPANMVSIDVDISAELLKKGQDLEVYLDE